MMEMILILTKPTRLVFLVDPDHDDVSDPEPEFVIVRGLEVVDGTVLHCLVIIASTPRY